MLSWSQLSVPLAIIYMMSYLIYINTSNLSNVYQESDMVLCALFVHDCLSLWQRCQVDITIPSAEEQTEALGGCVPCALSLTQVRLMPTPAHFPLVCISLLGVHNSPIPVSILHNSPSSQKKLKYNKGHIYNENKPPAPSSPHKRPSSLYQVTASDWLAPGAGLRTPDVQASSPDDACSWSKGSPG